MPQRSGSGKPRRGRPRYDRQYIQKLQLEVARLRALNGQRVGNTDLWKAIANVIAIAQTLEDQKHAVSSPTWDSSGHAAESPLFAGTYMAPAGPLLDEEGNPIDDTADPSYDETKHKGDREIYHSGKHAEQLLNHLVRNIEWAAQKARDRLVLRSAPVRPREPKLDDPQGCVACGGARV